MKEQEAIDNFRNRILKEFDVEAKDVVTHYDGNYRKGVLEGLRLARIITVHMGHFDSIEKPQA